jgi:uncharacterized protein (DUF983 family)
MLNRDVGLGILIRRGMRKKCPNCASGGIFESWFKLKDRCPTCGYSFEREEGYWVSAIIVNTAVIEGLFLIVFIVVVIATAPEVEWVPLLIIAVVMNLVFPIFFYPFSKTVWMGIDLYFHPLEAAERPQERS